GNGGLACFANGRGDAQRPQEILGGNRPLLDLSAETEANPVGSNQGGSQVGCTGPEMLLADGNSARVTREGRVHLPGLAQRRALVQGAGSQAVPQPGASRRHQTLEDGDRCLQAADGFTQVAELRQDKALVHDGSGQAILQLRASPPDQTLAEGDGRVE